jgi:hypothetical protein
VNAIAAQQPARDRDRVRLWLLLFGMLAAPGLWLLQLILGYGVSAQACYGGDHPTNIAGDSSLRTALLVFDLVALIAAVSGGIVSYAIWRAVRTEQRGDEHVVDIPAGRTRFMALWGLMSSACFLLAIVFNCIGSFMAPLCVH